MTLREDPMLRDVYHYLDDRDVMHSRFCLLLPTCSTVTATPNSPPTKHRSGGGGGGGE